MRKIYNFNYFKNIELNLKNIIYNKKCHLIIAKKD